MVRKTKEEAQETRSAILDAAELVFKENGVSRTSLAEIYRSFVKTNEGGRAD